MRVLVRRLVVYDIWYAGYEIMSWNVVIGMYKNELLHFDFLYHCFIYLLSYSFKNICIFGKVNVDMKLLKNTEV
jgi:hypothetical protein